MAWVNIEKPAKTEMPAEREKREILENVRRRAKARFYADENFPGVAVGILRQLGADVSIVREAGCTGHPDENHAASALRLGRVLITCDRDYLDERKFPLLRCPAIVVCDFGSGTESEIIDTYQCLWAILTAPQFFDKWTKIDAHRSAWSEYTRFQDGSTARQRYRRYQGRLQEWVEGDGT